MMGQRSVIAKTGRDDLVRFVQGRVGRGGLGRGHSRLGRSDGRGSLGQRKRDLQ